MKEIKNIGGDKKLFGLFMSYISSVKQLEKVNQKELKEQYSLEEVLLITEDVNKNIDGLTKYMNTEYGLDSQAVNAMVTKFCFQIEGN